MSLFRLVAKLSVDSTEFTAGMKRVESGVVSSMATIGRTIAGAFSVGAVLAFTQAAVKAAGDVADLADQLEITTGEVQALQKAADQSGMSLEKYAAVLGKIRKLKADFAAGDKAAAETFRRTGLNPNDDALSIMRGIGGLPDAQAFEILDAKSASLKASLQEIKALGPLELVRDQDVRAIDKAMDMMGDMYRIAKALTATAVGGQAFNALVATEVAKGLFENDQAFADGRALPVGDRMPKGYTASGRSMEMNGPDEFYGPTADEARMQTYLRQDRMRNRKMGPFSAIPTGDRANIGGFFGPNVDINRKMSTDIAAMRTRIESIEKVVTGAVVES